MIGSLKANNGSFANLASVQVQPAAVNSNMYAVQQQMKTVAVKDAILAKSPLITQGTSALGVASKTSMASIASAFGTEASLRYPYAIGNYLMPTHALSLDAGRTFDPRVAQGYVT